MSENLFSLSTFLLMLVLHPLHSKKLQLHKSTFYSTGNFMEMLKGNVRKYIWCVFIGCKCSLISSKVDVLLFAKSNEKMMEFISLRG